jgi:hypothetical protein
MIVRTRQINVPNEHDRLFLSPSVRYRIPSRCVRNKEGRPIRNYSANFLCCDCIFGPSIAGLQHLSEAVKDRNLGTHLHIIASNAKMVSFISKLKSMASSRPEPNAKVPPPLPAKANQKKRSQEHHPTSPSARLTPSILPELRTFFGPQSPKLRLGVLESPKSPESAYSGVALLGDVEIIRRVSKGKVKRIELSQVHTYETASAGTQTEERAVADNVKDLLKRRSGLAKSGWEWLHSGDVGLLFMSSTAEQKKSRGTDVLHDTETSLPLTGNLLLKLQQAIAVDAELQACQKRTAREIATLNAYHESLRKRKETLKEQLEGLKLMPNYDLDEEKSAVDKELVRVWEASIDTMDKRLKSEERLETKRDEFEQVARLALSVLVLGLAERMLVDVVDGRERADSEVEFDMRYRLPER